MSATERAQTTPPTSEPTNTAATDTTEAATATTTGATATSTAGTAAASGVQPGDPACGQPHGPYDEPAEAPAGEVRVAWNQAAYSFNAATNRGNAVANVNPLYLMNGPGFAYYDADLNLINNDQFGTCTIESLDPLTITYTVNEGVTWSDGTPVDAADILLAWAASSTVFNDANTVNTADGQTVAADADGNPVILGSDGNPIPFCTTEEGADPCPYDAAFDPEGATGAELLSGYSYQETSGVSFDSSSESWQLITQTPEVSADGRSVTATWDEFYVDYETAGLAPGVPAHVVGMEALGAADPAAGKQAVLDAIQNGDTAALKPISESWNRSFDVTSMPDNPGLVLGYGPYNLTGYDDNGTMTFEAREDYTWGPKPQLQTIVYSIISDPVAAVQAMENEEIDIIQPQATADLLTQLAGIADRGVVTVSGDGATYEHVDLAVANGGPFDPATYGGDAATALAVRQAFLHALPRQDIVDRLIVPLNPEATVRESFNVVPGSPEYDSTVSGNGSDEYSPAADIATAQQILTDAGVDTSTPIDVRLMYASNNPRRVSEYELIAASAAQAGFNVVDAGREDWGSQLANPSVYDAALFGWQSTAIDVAGSKANFVTDGQNNFYGYSSTVVDDLYNQLQQSTDPAEQADLMTQIEAQLYADAFGLPIFQHPSITAYNSTYVEGVSSIALSPTVFFDFWNWKATS